MNAFHVLANIPFPITPVSSDSDNSPSRSTRLLDAFYSTILTHFGMRLIVLFLHENNPAFFYGTRENKILLSPGTKIKIKITKAIKQLFG